MLENIPAAMKATNVISHIPREKAVFTPLNLLLDGFAIINKRRLLAGNGRTSETTQKC
jgi:hypothetical protein